MEILLVQPDNEEQLEAVKAVLKILKIDFKSQTEGSYNIEWEVKMKRSEADLKAGRTKEIKTDDLWQ